MIRVLMLNTVKERSGREGSPSTWDWVARRRTRGFLHANGSGGWFNRVESDVEVSVMWLSLLILTLLMLEDLLFFTFVGKASEISRYAQIYSALLVAGLIVIMSFHLSAAPGERLRGFAIAAMGVGARILAVRHLPMYSDVLQATEEAARAIVSGGNPYTHVFATGPKEVFAYPPFEPVYYLPFIALDIRYGEVFASSVTLILLYLAGRIFDSKLTMPVLTFYSFSGLLIASASVGVNDVSAGMLNLSAMILFAAAVQRRSTKLLIASGVVAGLAFCFKQFSVFFPFFSLVYLIQGRRLSWKPYLASFSSTTALIFTPYLVSSPCEFLNEVFTLHAWLRGYSAQLILYHALPEGLKPLYGSLLWKVAYVIIIVSALVFFARRIKNLRGVLAYSALAWLISLFLGRYMAITYFAFLAPVLCLLVFMPSEV